MITNNRTINEVSGNALHLSGDNTDTDRILPARFMKCITFDGIEAHVFKDTRAQMNGSHPFDLPENKGATILVVDRNFGSGSSREHAPQAIKRWGIQLIIGLSFADIFQGNATAIGLPCITIAPEEHEKIVRLLGRRDVVHRIDVSLKERLLSMDAPRNHDVVLCDIAMPSAQLSSLVLGTWDTTAGLLEAGEQIDAMDRQLPAIVRVEGGVP